VQALTSTPRQNRVAPASPIVLGIDFTCAPRAAKPITVAVGRVNGKGLAIERIDSLATFAAFEALLEGPGPWIGGFDFPFGLPRGLVEALGWPTRWPALIAHYAALDRTAIAAAFEAFRAKRPPGAKYAHRACDATSRAHSSMKLVNPPVALMLHAGAPRLLRAGVHLPAVHAGDAARVAVEAYPGLVMRSIAEHAGGSRAPSYKSDAPGMQTPARRDARLWLLDALQRGRHRFGIPVRLSRALAQRAVDDASGDTIDALAAAVQAVWALERADAGFGIPPEADRLEGWIVGA
jgi:hypothetical protein